MRHLIAALITVLTAVCVLSVPASAEPLRAGEFGSRDSVLAWINTYRTKRDVAHVPEAVRALSQLGAFKDPETAGVYVGFLAGIIASNPGNAEGIVDKMLPLPPEDQWVVVQAIAYSGLPEWRTLLETFAARMPTRRLMIDRYLAGKLPTLAQAGFETPPGKLDTLQGYLRLDFSGKPKEKRVALTPSPMLLDILWGYYCATGSFNPAVSRIVVLLSWANDRDDVAKLTLGSMARYTLAANASRDAKLLAMLKSVAKYYRKDVKATLDEVIEAAETADIARLRNEALVSIDELKRKGPNSRREISFWSQVGEGALALGCIAAAAVGQIELGVPCVVGGALTSAGLRYWDTQK
jgi:hypothetical protein